MPSGPETVPAMPAYMLEEVTLPPLPPLPSVMVLVRSLTNMAWTVPKVFTKSALKAALLNRLLELLALQPLEVAATSPPPVAGTDTPGGVGVVVVNSAVNHSDACVGEV